MYILLNKLYTIIIYKSLRAVYIELTKAGNPMAYRNKQEEPRKPVPKNPIFAHILAIFVPLIIVLLGLFAEPVKDFLLYVMQLLYDR